MLQNQLNRNPFTVPENYFERLPTQVQERYSAKQKAKAGLNIWNTAIKPRLAYIGGFGALALLAYGGISFLGNDNAIKNNAVANKARPMSAKEFFNSNAKSYAQFTNTDPSVHVVDDSKKSDFKMDEDDIMNYLAVENISVDDILGLE